MTDIYKVPAGDAYEVPRGGGECMDDDHEIGCLCGSGRTDTITQQADAETVHDPVANPSHYAGGRFPMECRYWTSILSFNHGNAFKYVWRHADKAVPIQDLEKALKYLEFAEEAKHSAYARRESAPIVSLRAMELLAMLEADGEGTYPAIYAALYLIYADKIRLARLVIGSELAALRALESAA